VSALSPTGELRILKSTLYTAAVTDDYRRSVRRYADVELRIVVEAALVIGVGSLFVVALVRRVDAGYAAVVLIPICAAVAWSLHKRWRARLANWQMLNGWRRRPVRREGLLVIQEHANGEEIGRVDTTDHYTVRWERFDAQRALYFVTQRDQKVTVSTLAPNAPDILREALQVANYPCEEWPNLDL
jgi:hypothetical protein